MSQPVCWVAFFHATCKVKRGGKVAGVLLVILDRGCLSHLVLVTPGCYSIPHQHPCRGLISTTLMDGLSGKGSMIQPTDALITAKQKTYDFFFCVFFPNKVKPFDLVWARIRKTKQLFYLHFTSLEEGRIQLKTSVFQPWGKLPSYCLSFFIGTNRHIVKMWASFFFC